MNATHPHVAGLVGEDLVGKVAVVTGAGGGMGRVIAGELARAGAHVVTVARDAFRTESVLREVIGDGGPGGFQVIQADLSLREGAIAAAAAISERHEQVHVLVNNAGAHFPDRRLTSDGVEMHVAVDPPPSLMMQQLSSGCTR
jgi:NAD(P)-dependent dehydrogenase (short-subunit alcohol dehydrogenase family)